jgi:hypothetical protein
MCKTAAVAPLVVFVLALALTTHRAVAQTLPQWELLGGVQSADTADTMWAARSVHKMSPPRAHIWMRHLLTTAAGSADIIYEYFVDCAQGTVGLESKRGELTPASKTGVQAYSGRMPVTPDEQRPSEPTPGSIEAVAYRTGCAWVSDAVSSQRSPEARGTPSLDRTWYPVLYAESPHDTIYVDTTHAHRVTRAPSLVSIWMRMTLHSADSLVINGKRASYIMAEDHVRCGDLKLMKLATIQFLAFDDRDVFLGAGDAADAPLHSVTEGTREWAAAALGCVHVLHQQRTP